jgi:hypothetical protein
VFLFNFVVILQLNSITAGPSYVYAHRDPSTCMLISAVGSETKTITFEGIPFPAEITAAGNPLSLLATGTHRTHGHLLHRRLVADS